MLEDVGRLDDALIEYETVVDANSRNADAWNNLGNLYGCMVACNATMKP